MYKVRIDQFEGPFDLLLYLLENARMDIYDIRVTEITEQYIGYLKEMDELNVEVGSEFIVLAAALIRLKSRMLLPRVTEVDEMIVEEDPRTELAERLTEYLQTKKIAEMLQRRERIFRHLHEAGRGYFGISQFAGRTAEDGSRTNLSRPSVLFWRKRSGWRKCGTGMNAFVGIAPPWRNELRPWHRCWNGNGKIRIPYPSRNSWHPMRIGTTRLCPLCPCWK